MDSEFSTKFEEVVEEEPLLYGDFMVPSADNKQYVYHRESPEGKQTSNI